MTHGTVSAYTNHRCRCEPCRVAMRSYHNDWRAKNPDRVRAARLRHADRAREKTKRWRLNNPDRIRANERKRLYGLTDEDYQTLLTQQDGRCAICRRHGELHVDHDHKTGVVRGLLCPRCNMALGLLGDDSERLTEAAAYLRRLD